MATKDIVEVLRRHARPLPGNADDRAALVASIGDAGIVLIGEATHGTHEFYRVRAELTAALIETRGFNVVAVEADWPDAYRVNRWVRHTSDDPDAQAALSDFTRFPRWMWRNQDVVWFLEWLREWNGRRPLAARAGFYGLDLYSLHASIAAVLSYLQQVDPAAAARARSRYGCFEDFAEDSQGYGYAATLGLTRSCEDDVIAELIEVRRRAAEYASRDGQLAADEYFFAEQNARLVRNAEEYYRAMFGRRDLTWNLRDTHMMETLDALLAHLRRHGAGAKAVVWAHNSHLGDARATQMGSRGELNLGQLVRERVGGEAFVIGFTTHGGTVTAASEWDEPAQRKRVRPSMEGSYERLFHEAGLDDFMVPLRETAVRDVLTEERLERAIGVIYRPDTERMSHYFRARLADQFDVVMHIDQTHALVPLEKWAHDESDAPETFPTGF
jgi:erythromycin esterase-like protein